MVAILDLPLVLLLRLIPGGAYVLYSSITAYILFFSIFGTLMYFGVGALIGYFLVKLRGPPTGRERALRD